MFVARVKWSRNAIPEEKEFGTEKEAKDYISTKESHPMFRWAEVDTKRQYPEKRAAQTERADTGRFKVTLDSKGGGTIRGPARYMMTRRFKELADSIDNGTCTLFHGLPLDLPRETLIEQVLQKDYTEFMMANETGRR